MDINDHVKRLFTSFKRHCGNGPKFTARNFIDWLREQLYIQSVPNLQGLSLCRIDTSKCHTPDNIAILDGTQKAFVRQKCSVWKGKKPTSALRGVSWAENVGKWMARITVNSKTQYLGVFMNEKAASAAYQKAVLAVKKQLPTPSSSVNEFTGALDGLIHSKPITKKITVSVS